MADRPISITVVNKLPSGQLQFTNANATHGTMPALQPGSPDPIGPGQEATVYAQDTGSGTIGPQGSFQYQVEGTEGSFDFVYNHPFGSGQTYAYPAVCPNGCTYTMPINHLPHHDAYCTIVLEELAGS